MVTTAKRSRSSSNIDLFEAPLEGDEVRYSISLVRQGEHRFYSLTIPSKVLASCSFATTKEEDPVTGFQRVLDDKRAQEIADYIDAGGTIPSSIVLSAQPAANFRSVDGSKTAAFTFCPGAFLILDGQHRVFGFAKAETVIRVPVVVYEGLSKHQEAKLFIDINTKQKPVPKELLLAIKSLAKDETDDEAILGEIFDLFDEDTSSALFGWTSSTKKTANKVDRVTFNVGIRNHLSIFNERSVSYIYDVFNNYFHAIMSNLRAKGIESAIAKKTTFRAFCDIFPDVAQRVLDRFDGDFSVENFSKVTVSVFNLPPQNFSHPSTKIQSLSQEMKKKLKAGLSI